MFSPFRLLACLALFSASLPSQGQESTPPVTDEVDTPVMVDGRKRGATTVQFMHESLNRYNKPEFPGIQTWLAEDGKMLNSLKGRPDKTWRDLNPDKLVTHNPVFWQMYYEVAPGDPGLAMLHAGALLTAGDADRAQTILRLTYHRGDLEKTVGDILLNIMRYCGTFQEPANTLVTEGTALHDKQDFAGAVAKYDAARRLSPRNGWATYERGLTIMARDKDKDMESEVVQEAFARSRRLQPFLWAAWQGSVAKVPGMQNMHAIVRPLWEESLKDINYVMTPHDLLKLSNALQDAEVDDYALVVRQIYVMRNGGYLSGDGSFIAKSLRRLAPGVRTEQSLERLSRKNVVFARLAEEPAGGQKQ